MRITFVCNEYPPRPQGGIGTFIYYLARGLKLLGHSITVAGMCDRDTEADDDGIRVVTRAASSARITLEDRRRFHSWLLSDVAANSTDVVEVPEFEGMLPFRFDACPVVVRLHQSQSGIALSGCRPPRPLIYWCERQTLRSHPYWIAVSRFVLEYTRRVFLLRPYHAEVIYNFAPPVWDRPHPETVTSLRGAFGDFVLYVGKLTEAKGAFDLARAARLFLTCHPGLSIVYVGDDLPRRGVLASQRIRTILGPKLSARAHFAGRRSHSEVMAWMSAARVYVQPSHLESFSMTTVEAMRSGVPVICSRRTSGREVVEDGRTGLLVEPSQPQQIAAAINRFCDEFSYAGSVVSAALVQVRSRFNLDRCVTDSLQYWTRCCSTLFGSAQPESQPFVWTADADLILGKVDRLGKRNSLSGH